MTTSTPADMAHLVTCWNVEIAYTEPHLFATYDEAQEFLQSPEGAGARYEGLVRIDDFERQLATEHVAMEARIAAAEMLAEEMEAEIDLMQAETLML
ncbi:MAG: hypothetical protein GDA36_01375 [Rhodobacteraceae bacterium]|nr:hypothetical protein [Paracoccaceae bacterium]